MISFKEYTSSEASSVQEGLLSGIVDKVKGRKQVGTTASGGKIYQSTRSKPSKVVYGDGKPTTKPTVSKRSSIDHDDPWLKSSSGAEKKAHYRQLRGEEFIPEESKEKYCRLCCKKEKREQCGYGPTMWDKYTVNDASEAEKKEAAIKSGILPEGMDMKSFKSNRQKNKRREASADAKKRGHVGKEWYNSGRTYSPDEAKRMRSKLDDEERRTRHRSAVDPDNEDDNNYSADKTKNLKKLRKQKAMGEMLSLSAYIKESAWTRKEGQNKSGGLNEKGRKSYERENPGSDLKSPSKKVGNPRRASFCARMKGMKRKLTSKKTASNPDSRINKSLRAWNC